MLLVQLVKLRLIAEKEIHAPWSTAITDVSNTGGISSMIYLKSLQASLRNFKANIPGNLSDNSKLPLILSSSFLVSFQGTFVLRSV